MNLTDYFDPIDFSQINTEDSPLGKYGLGPAVEVFSSAVTTKGLIKTHIAIFGVPETNGKRQPKGKSSPDRIRNSLYKLAAFETNLKIIDLGNLKAAKSPKGTFLALRDIIEYLNEFNIVSVVLGGSQELTLGICEAFRNQKFFWLSAVDAVLDVKKGTETFHSKNYLTRLFRNFPQLFHFSLIGYQQHLVSEQLLQKTGSFGSHLRLGALRDSIKQAELLLRNTNVLSFDMGAIKYNEAPGTSLQNPNGLYGEEACQLAHYAGLSPRLMVFGCFETVEKNDPDGRTAALAAEIIWYFLKGVSARKRSVLTTAYKVEIEGLDHPIVFRHERELNRWWFDVKAITGETMEIACSEEEYRQAASNEIPERWLRFIQKMDTHSK
ncbi:MAG: arginase family protein [Bacteroidota bacterium]